MTFLTPALAWLGLAAASIPIIIHLLNRRRFTRVDWAPMKYLKLTVQSNKRRLQIEQLLLLLLRVLAMLLLFATVARPMVSRGGFGSWLAGDQRKSQVIVIDDSMSMAQASLDGGHIFDRAKSAAIEMVRRANASDQTTVFTTSHPESPLARQSQIDGAGDLVRSISDLKPSHLMNQWATTFEWVNDYFESAAYPIREVVLVTDLRSAGWNAEIAKRTEEWSEQQATVTIVDVGRPLESNQLVTELRQISPVALAGSPTRFVAIVENASEESVPELKATLFVSGTPQSITVPPLDPNSRVEVPLRLLFSEPGRQRIRLELPDDLLNEDNSRFLVVDVRSSLSITMVDGDPRPTAFQSETDFLAASCSAGRAPWQVDVVRSASEIRLDESRPDVLVLANVGTIETDLAIQLEKLVRDGMGLVVYTGELVDPKSYNDLLFKNGQGILPARLKESAQDKITGMIIESVGNSPVEILTQLSPETLSRIKPHTIFGVAEFAADSTRVLASWKGTELAPALLERSFGNGRVYLWTVSADRDWSDWPQEPSFVLATRQTMEFAAAQEPSRANVTAGDLLQSRLQLADFPTEAKAIAPGLEGAFDLSVDATATGPRLRYENTRRSGFYQFTWTDRDGQLQSDDFAVSIDPRESDAKRLTEEQLDTYLKDVDWQLLSIGAADSNLDNQAELWRTGAMIFLGLIGCESLFAAWIGRER